MAQYDGAGKMSQYDCVATSVHTSSPLNTNTINTPLNLLVTNNVNQPAVPRVILPTKRFVYSRKFKV